MITPRQIVGVCTLHSQRRDHNLTVEVHHIVPVDWQTSGYTPVSPPAPGRDPEGRGELWDSRVVALAPTCHRNVHVMIVKQLRDYADHRDIEMLTSGATLPKQWKRMKEYPVAWLAIERFMDVGGAMAWLVNNGHWGQA